MKRLLWATHRLRDDMSASSRLGIADALAAAGWQVDWASPDGDLVVPRSRRLGRGHRSFTRNMARVLAGADLSVYQVAIIEWPAVSGALESLLGAGLPWLIMDRSPPVSTGLVGYFQRLQHKEAWNMARVFAAGRVVKSAHMGASESWSKPSATVLAGVHPEAFSLAPLNPAVRLVCHGSLAPVRELHRLDALGHPVHLFGHGAKGLRGTNLEVEGPTDIAGVATRLQAADIGILHLPDRPVWSHASPLKVAEYAAAGLCVVASAVSGLEGLRDAPWLRLIPLGDDAALASAVAEFAAMDIEVRRELGRQARADAATHLSWSVVTQPLIALLDEVAR